MLDDLKQIHERDAHDVLGVVERQARKKAAASGYDVSPIEQWAAVIPTKRNLAKQIALEVIGKTPVICSGQSLNIATQSWKQSFNRYAKHLAWTSQFPKFMDAELTGWSKQPVHKPYAIIELRSGHDDVVTIKAFEVAERLLSGLRPAPIAVEVMGDTIEAQQWWASTLGEFVAVYTALLCGVNPASTTLFDKASKLMEENNE